MVNPTLTNGEKNGALSLANGDGTRENYTSDNQNIGGYLTKPIPRLTRYSLLLMFDWDTCHPTSDSTRALFAYFDDPSFSLPPCRVDNTR